MILKKISNWLQIWNKILPEIPPNPDPATRGIGFSFPDPRGMKITGELASLSTTSEVKNDHAHVITQDICNKFIECDYGIAAKSSVATFNYHVSY